MEIGIGILAFLVYIIFVMAWYLLLKRSIAEAMLLGLIIVCAFNGVGTLPQTFAASLTKALKQDVMAAIILFTVMASIMTQTGIITRLVNILNSILGRFRGGPAYVSACASAMFGMVSGASSANAATVGSITIPWMTESGWPKEVGSHHEHRKRRPGDLYPAVLVHVLNAGAAGGSRCGHCGRSLYRPDVRRSLDSGVQASPDPVLRRKI